MRFHEGIAVPIRSTQSHVHRTAVLQTKARRHLHSRYFARALDQSPRTGGLRGFGPADLRLAGCE